MALITSTCTVVNGKRVTISSPSLAPRMRAVVNGKMGIFPIDRVATALLAGQEVEADVAHLVDLATEWDIRLAAVLLIWFYSQT